MASTREQARLPAALQVPGLERPTLGRQAREIAAIALLAMLYMGAARLGFLLDPVAGFASLVWPPAGLALAALYLKGSRLWPGVAIGAVVTNLALGAPAFASLGIGLGNTVEALLGAYWLRQARFRPAFDGVRNVLLLMLVAAVCPLASSTAGVGSLFLAGKVAGEELFEAWVAWWTGDSVGTLLVGSFLIAWSGLRRPRLPPNRVVEVAALAITVASIGLLTFFTPFGPGAVQHPVSAGRYMVFPPLIWAAIRFGPRGATAGALGMSIFSVLGTALHRGPFVDASTLSRNLLQLQIFMSTASISSMLLAAAVSEQAVRWREELLSTVAHDLRNPLNNIKINVRLARAATPDDSMLRRHLDMIGRSADRMVELVSSLLDLSTMHAGRLVLTRGPQDAGALLRDALEMVRPLAEEKQQQLTSALPERTVEVQCDRGRVLQALSNLLVNAVKYTPEQGHIAAGVQVIGHAALFYVADDGPGIAPEMLPHLFDRYSRAAVGRGTGLGLSIAKGIVVAHGGEMRVASQADVGTTFSFTLPLQ